MKKILLTPVFISLFFSLQLCAQNASPILAMDVTTTPVSGFLLPDSSVFYSNTTVFNVHIHVSLFDTTGINNVIVKVGRTSGSSDVIESSYAFDTYRNGYDIVIDLGNYSNLLHYYAEVKLELSDATLTDAVTFSR
jgi:hypothetical protein